MQLRKIKLMLLLAVAEEMKKKQGQKSDFFPIVMNSDNGILKISDRNCGIFSMGVKIWANIFGFFLLVTGQNWTFGNIFMKKKLLYPVCIIRISVKHFVAMVYGLLM